MAISLHQATVAQYLQILPSMIGLLDKAEAWAAEQGIGADEILGKQLAPDMWPLGRQFRQAAAHSARALTAVETGRFSPDMEPALIDFASVRTVLNDALAIVQGIDADTLEAQADKVIAFEFGGEVRMRFTAQDFLLSFSQPNFYFHTTIIYSILRNLGVKVGKRDYLGKPRIIQPA